MRNFYLGLHLFCICTAAGSQNPNDTPIVLRESPVEVFLLGGQGIGLEVSLAYDIVKAHGGGYRSGDETGRG